MKEFSISERFRLEIHWRNVIYEQEGIARLEDCYLSGPVIKEVAQMSGNDFMDLDFTNQYLVIIPSYYIARFSWGDVRHTPDNIFLSDVVLKNKYVNSVPKLNNDDYIVIDTADHEDEKHAFSLVYVSYLLNSDGQLYNFGGE